MDKTPRIALVTDAIGPFNRGGKEQRYLELARRLARDADVHVYTMNWWRGSSLRIDQGVTYHAICPLVPLYSGDRRSIRQAVLFAVCCLRLLVERFDVIEADHMPYVQLLPLKVVSLVRRRRLVVTWHESWGPDYWLEYLGALGRIGWMLESLAMRLPDLIIAASAHTAGRLRMLTRGRVPVVSAPNGIDLEKIALSAASPATVDVVTVGRLLAHKRVDLLVRAVARLRDRAEPVSACIIGVGPELGRLRRLAEELHVADLVQFREDVADHETLFGAIKAARVAVFPSEREGFGIAVLEALACGLPVIVTSAPDNLARHLVERAGPFGRVVDPDSEAIADAIAEVLDEADFEAHRSVGWLTEYDWDTVSRTVADALSPPSLGTRE